MPRKAKRDCAENPFEKGPHAPDLRELARQCMGLFLGDKITHRDQPIPRKLLYSEDSFRTVLRTPFDDDTFNYIHEKCLSKIPKLPWYRESTVPWNVHYLLGLIEELRSLHVPKEFQPGLILLYFKFCKGFDIPPPPLL
jgi:hypothetical protein